MVSRSAAYLAACIVTIIPPFLSFKINRTWVVLVVVVFLLLLDELEGISMLG